VHTKQFVAVVAIVASPLLLLGTAEAAAPPPVRFTFVQYDSPGNDSGSNKSLNAEWIRVTNFGVKARDLTGWTIRDPKNHVYTFPSFKLGIGMSVRIHTGSGKNTRRNLYWGEDSYVWNNTGDKAVLRRGKSNVDTCRWKDADTKDLINSTKC
jgi:hypothetical protein